MKIFLVMWLTTSYQCPVWLESKLSTFAKDLVCAKRVEKKYHLTSQAEDAKRVARNSGDADVIVLEVTGLRIKALDKTWR